MKDGGTGNVGKARWFADKCVMAVVVAMLAGSYVEFFRLHAWTGLALVFGAGLLGNAADALGILVPEDTAKGEGRRATSDERRVTSDK